MIHVIKRIDGGILKTQSGRVIAYDTEERAQDEIDRMEGDRATRGLAPRGYQIIEYRESDE